MFNKRLILSVISFIISVIYLVNVPLVKNFAYVEEGYIETINIYPSYNTFFEEFNGVKIGRQPIQVLTNHVYFDSYLISYDEGIDLSDGTFFEIDSKRSYSISMSDNEELFLDRNLRYLNGIDISKLSFFYHLTH